MPATASPRTTRQRAVGRFRETRLANRDRDLAERQKMILTVAERVLRIVEETQRALGETARDRQAWGDRMRSELTQGHLNLSETTMKNLLACSQLRGVTGEKAHRDREAFVEKLRADVVRIVSEDFI